MADFDSSFLGAFNHAMIYEVGGFWNPNDPDVIYGNIDTKDQRRKVGYVNIPADRGGETKYGIAQKAHPELPVRTLDLNAAMTCYYNDYWIKGANDRLPYPLTIIHMDGCINHGTGRAVRFLQQAVGVQADGVIGNGTLGAVNAMNQADIIQGISNIRASFYNSIVQRDPSQGVFLAGWMRRINEVTQFTLSQLS